MAARRCIWPPAINGARDRGKQTEFSSNGDIRIDGGVALECTRTVWARFNSLRVEGKTGAWGVYVNASGTWPDYVFAPSYQLRPLAEVARFIRVNQHLPDVPSAAEVRVNGLHLSDIDARLLRKIEELTLDLLEQQRENAALKARVECLENAGR